ncbi:alkyl/aryl-sulfatase [Aquisediminimonas profunda]|uniref:alkyl/aryl-sulfatase n=1 Tax=Aquisediminimonas profunda TaxID=1550733 RepID=UPI001C631A0A|nr:alkyl sulfatase dimerization domain-containing protein [Aquisediminimonas profunda]
MSTTAMGQTPDLSTKPASAATIAAQAAERAALPRENGKDAGFAAQGFVATRADPIIRNKDGKPVWNLAAYDWMKGDAPATVNPSLWRHMSILRKNGLFKLADGMWQVRGFDVSNMTVIAGKTGWILIDPLTNRETSAAALELVNQQLGTRPIVAVIYTHSHADHFGGIRGIVSPEEIKTGKVTILAPEHFIKETASENVIAGPAMGRRATFQFGAALAPGPSGQMGSGIGSAVAAGEITLIAPTDTITKTGEQRTIDGVSMEFQMVPQTEAPAELNVMFPDRKTLVIGEIATCSLHNILTPRGAQVRDALAWAGYLTEAIRLYADRTDTVAASHCWPHFGKSEVRNYLTLQRDNYKYLHDQTVRLMNKGLTQAEIAEALVPPPALTNEWTNRGYYGTYSHNSKAIYQRYLGWYDANPANLNPHPPAERARLYVEAMGGAERVMAIAQAAMTKGDYRWSSDILNQLVFADPQNANARALLADSYEQQGYQSEAATWRNMFLSAAHDLREGPKPGSSTTSLDMISAIPTDLLLDSIATRLDPAVIGSAALALNFNFSDRNEKARVTVENAVMISEMGEAHAKPAVTLTGPRQFFLGLFFLKLPLAQLEAAGLKIEGDRTAIEALQAAIETPPNVFNIVTP